MNALSRLRALAFSAASAAALALALYAPAAARASSNPISNADISGTSTIGGTVSLTATQTVSGSIFIPNGKFSLTGGTISLASGTVTGAANIIPASMVGGGASFWTTSGSGATVSSSGGFFNLGANTISLSGNNTFAALSISGTTISLSNQTIVYNGGNGQFQFGTAAGAKLSGSGGTGISLTNPTAIGSTNGGAPLTITYASTTYGSFINFATDANANLFSMGAGGSTAVAGGDGVAIANKFYGTVGGGNTVSFTIHSTSAVMTIWKGLNVGNGTTITQIRMPTTQSMTAGVATFSDASLTANSRIVALSVTPSGTVGALYLRGRGATTFSISSTSNTDTSSISALIIEP